MCLAILGYDQAEHADLRPHDHVGHPHRRPQDHARTELILPSECTVVRAREGALVCSERLRLGMEGTGSEG
jgi:hypothetical protein